MSPLTILSIWLLVVGNSLNEVRANDGIDTAKELIKPVEDHTRTFAEHGFGLDMDMRNEHVEKRMLDSIIDIIVDGQSKEQIEELKKDKESMKETLEKTFGCKRLIDVVKSGSDLFPEVVVYSKTPYVSNVIKFCYILLENRFLDKTHGEFKKRYSKLNNLFNKN